MSLHNTSRRLTQALGLGALFAALSTAAFAQSAVLGVTYGTTTPGTPTTISNYANGTSFTFDNTSTPLVSVTTSLTTYNLSSSAGNSIYFRRGASLANYNPTLLLPSSGPNATSTTTLSTLTNYMGGGNSLNAVSSIFDNQTGTGIERIDVNFAGGYTVKTGDSLVFFGLNVAAGESFRVAPITGWDSATNSVTAFGSTGALVTPAAFGGGILQPDSQPVSSNYYAAGFNQGDNVSGTPSFLVNAGSMNLYGVVISFADLGVNAGSTIYGFSLMAGDVAGATASDLLDYNNTLVYLNNTNATSGGFNFTNFSTAVASPVPEPSTYGAILAAGSLGFFAWRRRRERRSTAAQS